MIFGFDLWPSSRAVARFVLLAMLATIVGLAVSMATCQAVSW